MFIFNKKKIDKRPIAFSATDAKTLALNVQIKQKEDEFERIIKEIQVEASEGEMQYRCFNLCPENISKLKELGYKVSPCTRNSFKISWGEWDQ